MYSKIDDARRGVVGEIRDSHDHRELRASCNVPNGQSVCRVEHG